MKFNMMKLIRKSLLVSVMLGSSAFMFNNVYAATISSSSSLATPSAEQAAVIKKMQDSMSAKYDEWLKSNENASDADKTSKQEELLSEAYNELSDSDKKLIDSYVQSMASSTSSSSSSSTKSSSSTSSSKTTSSSSSSTSTTKTASSSAKTTTGDPCALSLLGMSLLGSLSTCISLRKKH